MCPLFCCLFINTKCCCASSSDEEDSFEDEHGMRRPLLKSKSKQFRKYYSQKKSKPRDVNNKKNRSLCVSTPGFSASPIIHSGLKRLPFHGTLSDLTERSEEESCALSSAILEEDESPFHFQYEEEASSIIISEMEEHERKHANWDKEFSGVNAKSSRNGSEEVGGIRSPLIIHSDSRDSNVNSRSKK